MPRRKPEPVPPEPTPELVPTWEWERLALSDGWGIVAGVDEAGRGPLAGPVVAAAVVLPAGWECAELRDSKCLPQPVREVLYERIICEAVCWSVAEAGVREIDRWNILRATHLAMRRALGGLKPSADGALVDGLPVKGLPCRHRAIVDGDALSVSIAAASVLAKVSRDRLMQALDVTYPGYGFAQHKGYATPEHRLRLVELGPSPCHRRSFRPVREQCTDEELSLPFGAESSSIDADYKQE